ncbi:BstXI family restriction endonuclease [Phormidium pseudopriestleyi FRX01]|uniref:BstXI family restriction endonuclease n=1 Tax=Phormidium pseudopriestleyi FRX01 TaxID=1759528 RepID=A0ABS3FLI7_9CYAN|nr:BstXI family restriction endonuclease [Phormidium pseudopriestleyi FRX01]
MSKLKNPPTLPQVLKDKIYKTGQTRGSDNDVIYQNRVNRNNTVLIPYEFWDQVSLPPSGESCFEKGFICLIKPQDYFTNSNIESDLQERSLTLGVNALVFYQKRLDWGKYNPERLGWNLANNRTNPLQGNYVARVAATTSSTNGEKICRGFNKTSMKGAGIRLFEYAS